LFINIFSHQLESFWTLKYWGYKSTFRQDKGQKKNPYQF